MQSHAILAFAAVLALGLGLTLTLTLTANKGTDSPTSIPIDTSTNTTDSMKEIARQSFIYTVTKYSRNENTTSTFQVLRAVSADLINCGNFLFTCNVRIGSQTVPMFVDTASADTWVRGPACKSTDGSCDSSFPKVSTSNFNSLLRSFDVRYGSGSVKGNIFRAPVSISGSTGTLPIGFATELNGFITKDAAGLLGLGLNKLSKISESTGLNANLIDALSFQTFSFYLGNYPKPGEMTLGGHNAARFTGPISYFKLTSDKYFQFDVSTWAIHVGRLVGQGDNEYGILFRQTFVKSNNQAHAIADTGSTLFILNNENSFLADEINKAIGAGEYDSGYGIYPIDCNKRNQDVPITIFARVNSQLTKFTIPASIYVMDSYDGTGFCFSGITKTYAAMPNIFGLPFLRQYVSIFDKANKQIGFAKAIH